MNKEGGKPLKIGGYMKDQSQYKKYAGTWALYTGLFVVLGFNLSWNPQQPQLARNDSKSLQSFEYASIIDVIGAVTTSAQGHAAEDGPQLPPAPPEASEQTKPQPRASTNDTAKGPKMQPPRKGSATAKPEAKTNEEKITAGKNESANEEEETLAKEQNIKAGKLSFKQNDKIHLGDMDPSLKDVSVEYAINNDLNRVQLHIEGKSICDECSPFQLLTLDKSDITNLQYLKLAIANHVSKLARDSKSKSTGYSASDKDRRSPFKPTHEKSDKDEGRIARLNDQLEKLKNARSSCKKASKKYDLSERYDCLTDEFTELVDKCDNLETEGLSERNTTVMEKACETGIKRYFTKYLSNDIRRGLSADPNSEAYALAANARDSVLSVVPGDQMEILRNLTASTGVGIVNRAQNYDTTLMGQCQALGQNNCQEIVGLRTQIYLRNQAAVSNSLKSSMLGSNFDPSEANKVYMQNFESPLMQLLKQDYRRPYNWQLAANSFEQGSTITGLDTNPGNGPQLTQQPNNPNNRQPVINNGPMLPNQAPNYSTSGPNYNQYNGTGGPMMQPARPQQPANSQIRTAL